MGIQERKEREKEQRRQEILDAAKQVFFAKSLQDATMDEIAEKAELSKSTLYLYYKSKEDLFLAVSLQGAEILRGLFEQAIATGEPAIKLISNLGEAYYAFFRNHRGYFRLQYFNESPQMPSQVSPEMHQMCCKSDQMIWELVKTPIRKGIDEGMLHSDLDPMEAAVILWSNSNGLMRLIDRGENQWLTDLGIDLDSTLRKSNAFLVEAMMTKKALEQYGSTLTYHISDNGPGEGTDVDTSHE